MTVWLRRDRDDTVELGGLKATANFVLIVGEEFVEVGIGSGGEIDDGFIAFGTVATLP